MELCKSLELNQMTNLSAGQDHSHLMGSKGTHYVLNNMNSSMQRLDFKKWGFNLTLATVQIMMKVWEKQKLGPVLQEPRGEPWWDTNSRAMRHKHLHIIRAATLWLCLNIKCAAYLDSISWTQTHSGSFQCWCLIPKCCQVRQLTGFWHAAFVWSN